MQGTNRSAEGGEEPAMWPRMWVRTTAVSYQVGRRDKRRAKIATGIQITKRLLYNNATYCNCSCIYKPLVTCHSISFIRSIFYVEQYQVYTSHADRICWVFFCIFSRIKQRTLFGSSENSLFSSHSWCMFPSYTTTARIWRLSWSVKAADPSVAAAAAAAAVPKLHLSHLWFYMIPGILYLHNVSNYLSTSK